MKASVAGYADLHSSERSLTLQFVLHSSERNAKFNFAICSDDLSGGRPSLLSWPSSNNVVNNHAHYLTTKFILNIPALPSWLSTLPWMMIYLTWIFIYLHIFLSVLLPDFVKFCSLTVFLFYTALVSSSTCVIRTARVICSRRLMDCRGRRRTISHVMLSSMLEVKPSVLVKISWLHRVHCKNARTPDVCSQNYTQCVGV